MSAPNYAQTSAGPADYGFQITPSDTVDLGMMTRAVYSASGGVVKWHNVLGEEQHTTIPPEGTKAIKARRILATGTTATGLEGLA